MAFTRIRGAGIHTAANINSHNINSTGIITAVSFVGDGSGLTGVASTDNIITGTAATFTGGVDINSDLDVDGHTNLDNVSIAGVTTFSGGLTGTTANFSGNVTVGGVLTYEDVKNVDSIGIITARSGLDVDDFLDVGTSIKLGNAGIITATTFKGDGDFVELDVDGQTNLDNVSVAGVTTHNEDVWFKGATSNRDAYWDKSANTLYFKDNARIYLGNSSDFRIYHTPNSGAYGGSNILGANGHPIQLMTSMNGAGENGIIINPNSDVKIYYDNAIKLQTTAKGIQVGTGVTIETNGQATYTGIVTATAFKLANGSDVGTGAGGTWSTYTAGIATSKSVGVNTSNLDDTDLTGIGNSFKGLYISNGMIVHDNVLNGNHYIGTSMNGLMAGPVTINGNLEIDGNYVVV